MTALANDAMRLTELLRNFAAGWNASIPESPSAACRTLHKLSSVWPRLRHETTYFETPSGVVIRNDSGATFIRGEVAFNLLRELAPHLSGRHSVADLCAGLPDAARNALAGFIRLLVESGMAEDLGPEITCAPAAREAPFERQLDLLERLVERPREAFARIQASSVLLIGRGSSFRTCEALLLSAGVQKLAVWPVRDEDVFEATAGTSSAAAGPTASILDRLSDEHLNGQALVINCSDRPTLRDVIAINVACCAARRSLLVGFALERFSVMGPLVDSIHGGCWVCGLCILRRAIPDAGIQRTLNRLRSTQGASDHIETDPRIARALGKEVGFEAFKLLAGSRRAQTVDRAVFQTVDSAGRFSVMPIETTIGHCCAFCEVTGVWEWRSQFGEPDAFTA